MAAEFEYGTNGGVGAQNIFVDTAQLTAKLEAINTQLTNIKNAIDAYSADAKSLVGSSFKDRVDGNLVGLKTSYTNNLVPVIEKMQADITAVKDEYERRATTIANSGSQASATAGSGSTSSSANYTY